jgi:uncharacterized phiE125 gp8 family phage protein
MMIPAGRVKITEPTVEPVSTTEAKLHLRIDHSTEDTYIASLIKAARLYVESIVGRALVTRTYTAKLDAFPSSPFYLPYPPLATVGSIKYTDDDAVTLTFASSNYTVDLYSEPGRVILNSDATWPSVTLADINGVEIVYTAGYGAAGSNVPELFRQAILLLVAHLYENREAVAVAQGISVTTVPLAFESLIMAERVNWF